MKARLERRIHGLTVPVAASHGTTHTRSLLILRLEDADGTVGLGEAAPIDRYSTAGFDQCAMALEAVMTVLPACDPDDPDATLESTAVELPAPARAALECALRDLHARRLGVPITDLLGGACSTAIPLRRLLAGASPVELAEAAAVARADGFDSMKLKLGSDRGRDERSLAMVRDETGPTCHLSGDANGAWDVGQARERIEAVRGGLLDLVEQPVRGLDGMRSLRDCGMPIALDEDATAAGALLPPPAADAVCIKVQSFGGMDRAVAAAAEAREAGMAVLVGGSLEGAVGTAASLAAALVIGPELAGGLSTLDLFDEEFPALMPSRGVLAGPGGPGLGVDPDGEPA